MDASLSGEVTLGRLPLRFPLCTMHFEILNYEFMPEFEKRQETEMTVRQKSHYLIRACDRQPPCPRRWLDSAKNTNTCKCAV